MQVPARSISLPARLHPIIVKIETVLSKLRTCESSSSSVAGAWRTIPLHAESVQSGLIRLAELYNCLEEFIHSPCTQQTLHSHEHKNLVEKSLDTSIGMLDACSNARDLILTMKEQVQELQSALRRRGGDLSMESNVHAYISFRKKSKREIAKCLRELKRIESNMGSLAPMVVVDHQQLSMVIQVLRESSATTISTFRAILLFLSSDPSTMTKAGGWSLIRKLIPAAASTRKRGGEIYNEVGSADSALHALHGHIPNNYAKFDVQMALKRLETLDVSIKGLEDGLDCLFRRLIQNRVSLLNILTP